MRSIHLLRPLHAEAPPGRQHRRSSWARVGHGHQGQPGRAHFVQVLCGTAAAREPGRGWYAPFCAVSVWSLACVVLMHKLSLPPTPPNADNMIDSTTDLDSPPDLKVLRGQAGCVPTWTSVVSFGHRRRHVSLRTLGLQTAIPSKSTSRPQARTGWLQHASQITLPFLKSFSFNSLDISNLKPPAGRFSNR